MTMLYVASIYRDAIEVHSAYEGALHAQADMRAKTMRLTDEVAEREIAVQAELMAANNGEIPGSNADKRKAAVGAAEQDDKELVSSRKVLAATKRDALVKDARVVAFYMKLQIMRAYLGALGSLGA